MKSRNTNRVPYIKGEMVWLEPYVRTGIKTEQGVLIPFKAGIPEEKLKCKIVKKKKNEYDIPKIKFLSYSHLRKRPDCSYYYKCGGCQWLNTNYEETVNRKKARLEYLAQKYSVNVSDKIEFRKCEQPYHTRHKAVFPVREINGERKTGLFREGSHDIIEIEDCLMLHPDINRALSVFRFWLKESSVTAYNEQSLSGDLKYVLLQKSYYGNEMSLTLITASPQIPELTRLEKNLRANGIDINSLNIMVNDSTGNTIFTDKIINFSGRKYLRDKFLNLHLQIYPGSFFQANPIVAEQLFKELKSTVKTLGIEKIYELYAGTGIIGLLLSDTVKRVSAFEINEAAVKSGNLTAKENGINNFSLQQTDLHRSLPDISEDYDEDNIKKAFLADPPRKGLTKNVIGILSETAYQYFIYISCNPNTFFRDAFSLINNGLELIKLEAFDFFPYTPHIEILSFFRKEKGQKKDK